MVAAWVRPPLVLENVKLEDLDFAQQVRLFASAVMVIGQHGAGLGNSVWMEPGGTVVELTNRPNLRHFQKISGGMGHRHVLQVTPGPHAPIDVEALRSLLEGERPFVPSASSHSYSATPQAAPQ